MAITPTHPKILDMSAGDSKSSKEPLHTGDIIDLKTLGDSELLKGELKSKHLKEDEDKFIYCDQNFPGMEFIFDKKSSHSFKLFKERVSEIIQYLLRHPEATYLIKNVLKQGPIHVQWVPHAKLLSTAAWQKGTRSIFIKDDYIKVENGSNFESIQSFLFEVNNANNSELNAIKFSDFENETEYADAIEKAEFETSLNTYNLLVLGGKNYGLFPKESARLFKPTSFNLEKTKTPSLSYHGFSHYGGYELEHLMFSLQKYKYKLYEVQAELARQYHLLTHLKHSEMLKAKLAPGKAIVFQESKDIKETEEIIAKREAEIKNLTFIIDSKHDRFVKLISERLEIRGTLAADEIVQNDEIEDKRSNEREQLIQILIKGLEQEIENQALLLKMNEENIAMLRQIEAIKFNKKGFWGKLGALGALVFGKVQEENPSLAALLDQEKRIKELLSNNIRKRDEQMKILEENKLKDRERNNYSKFSARRFAEHGKNLSLCYKVYFTCLHNHQLAARDYFFLSERHVKEYQMFFEFVKFSRLAATKVKAPTEILAMLNEIDFLCQKQQILQGKKHLELQCPTLYGPDGVRRHIVEDAKQDLVVLNERMRDLEEKMNKYKSQWSSAPLMPKAPEFSSIVVDELGLAERRKKTEDMRLDNGQYPIFSEKDGVSLAGCKSLNALSQSMQAEISELQRLHSENIDHHFSFMQKMQNSAASMREFYINSIKYFHQMDVFESDQQTHLLLLQYSFDKAKHEYVMASMKVEALEIELEKAKQNLQM